MNIRRFAFLRAVRGHLLAAALPVLLLPACQTDQPRLQQLEAAQQQQARELARLRRELAERDEEVAQLEDCVSNLEDAVYEDDSTADDEGRVPPSVRL